MSDSDAPSADELNQQESTSMERDRLYMERDMHLSALKRFFRQISHSESRDSLSRGELQALNERIRAHFNEFEKVHRAYRAITLLSSDDIYHHTERKFMTAIGTISQELHEQNSREHDSFNFSGMSANSTMTGQQVIRVETPRQPRLTKFNGNPADWPAFRDLFIAEVHDKNYDDVTKLLHLQGSCTDRAARALGPWPPVAVNYLPAWQTLVRAYDDTYHIVHGILARAHSIQKYEQENYEALSAISDGARNAERQLSAVVSAKEREEQMWIFMLKQKMPRATCEAWEAFRNNRTWNNQLPPLASFLEFLNTRAKGKRELEYGDSTMTPEPKRDPKTKNGGSQSQTKTKPTSGDRPSQPKSSSYGPRACVMPQCNQTHYLGQCEAFKKLNMSRRLDKIKEHTLCRCCLLPGHFSNNCKRESCPGAKGKHHHLVCPKLIKPNQPPNGDTKQEITAQ